jgi:NADPH-dependent glutamate synthase beta subunit-like oxidoreductase
MMQAVQMLDKFLGPLTPSRQAHASAPNPKRVLVFGASEPQGLAVADTLSKKGKYVVTAVFEDMAHEYAAGGCMI